MDGVEKLKCIKNEKKVKADTFANQFVKFNTVPIFEGFFYF